jgi:hypothetical protein
MRHSRTNATPCPRNPDVPHQFSPFAAAGDALAAAMAAARSKLLSIWRLPDT